VKIRSLKLSNYRTLENVELTFPASYAAICGANDSGKTNVVRAIRALMKEESSPFMFPDQEELSAKDDYPKWKDTEPEKREIEFDLAVTAHLERDAGFYQVVVKQLSLIDPPETLDLVLKVTYRADRPEPNVVVRICGKEYSDLNAQEVLKKLQSSKSILFYNSTQVVPRGLFGGQSMGGYIRDISGQHEDLMLSMKKTVTKTLSKISKTQQVELEALLGRLETKYKVGLTLPTFDVGRLPFSITLGDRKVEVPLDDWGSGTKNRTQILLTLFRAKQVSEAEPSASKVTPVIVIEEPESFLHPSAQAEFGRILNDLAEEFQSGHRHDT
jgi:putative ATP-dependent endonuclease of the OLD family